MLVPASAVAKQVVEDHFAESATPEAALLVEKEYFCEKAEGVIAHQKVFACWYLGLKRITPRNKLTSQTSVPRPTRDCHLWQTFTHLPVSKIVLLKNHRYCFVVSAVCRIVKEEKPAMRAVIFCALSTLATAQNSLDGGPYFDTENVYPSPNTTGSTWEDALSQTNAFISQLNLTEKV